MQFYLGLSRLSREEMIILISHMTCITGWNLVVNHAIVNAVKLKTAVFEGVSGVLTRQGKDTYAEKVWKANKRIECQVQSLVRVMESEHDRLSRYSDRALIFRNAWNM